MELEGEESSTAQGRPSTPTLKTANVNKRPHSRTSDLLAGGITRSHLAGEKSILWVCERCFKYMAEGSVWELHAVSTLCLSFQTGMVKLISSEKKCDRRRPPGRKVYQRGAHTIWEVDGAKEKVSQASDKRPRMPSSCNSYSCIVKTCRFSGNSSLMSRPYSLTVTTVSAWLHYLLPTKPECE